MSARDGPLAMPAAVAIDLDGTLLDTAPDLAAAADATLAELGRPPCGEEPVRCYVGNGIERFVHRFLTGDMQRDADAALFARAMPLFRRLYAEFNGRASRAYPGVVEGLQALRARGLPLACLTNKAEAFTLPLLESSGLAPSFQLVVAGDTLARKKPDPMPLLHVAKRLGCEPPALLMVGDSANDVRAARAAGCPVVCVPYGYNHGRDIGDESPDRVITSLADVARLLPAALCRG